MMHRTYGQGVIEEKVAILAQILVGTGSVSCNSVFVPHLCRFLEQEKLMEREAMVQNP